MCPDYWQVSPTDPPPKYVLLTTWSSCGFCTGFFILSPGQELLVDGNPAVINKLLYSLFKDDKYLKTDAFPPESEGI